MTLIKNVHFGKAMIKACLPLLVVLQTSCASLLDLGNSNLRTVKVWESQFLNKWDKEYEKSISLSLSGDSYDLYNLSYSVDANTSMFEATGDEKYLDRALLYVNNVMSKASKSKTLRKSGYSDEKLSWANNNSPSHKGNGREYPLYESYLWRYVTKLLVVMEQAETTNKIKYKKNYEEIITFTEENIYNKWNHRNEKNIYRSNVHMTSHWAIIALNMYTLTGEKKYKIILDRFIAKFNERRHVLYTAQGIEVFDWDTVWKREYTTSQDVSHGNAVIGAIIEIYERDYAFTKKDIQALIILFNKTIWKTDITFADNIDGSGMGSGWFTDGFIKLGRYDSKLQRRIESHTKGRTTQFYANGALNAYHLLQHTN